MTLLRLFIVTVLLATLGCAKKFEIPKEKVSVDFVVPFELSLVQEECPKALIEYIFPGSDIKVPPINKSKLFISGDNAVTILRTSNPALVTGTVIHNVANYEPSFGQSRISGEHLDRLIKEKRLKSLSGEIEQWSILMEPVGEQTRLHVYHHYRQEKKGIPLSDGKEEGEFIDELRELLERD
jgi:hypothetical protein